MTNRRSLLVGLTLFSVSLLLTLLGVELLLPVGVLDPREARPTAVSERPK